MTGAAVESGVKVFLVWTSVCPFYLVVAFRLVVRFGGVVAYVHHRGWFSVCGNLCMIAPVGSYVTSTSWVVRSGLRPPLVWFGVGLVGAFLLHLLLPRFSPRGCFPPRELVSWGMFPTSTSWVVRSCLRPPLVWFGLTVVLVCIYACVH